MTPDRDKAARDLLPFYAEAGVDALVGEEPVDRFAEPARRAGGSRCAAPERARRSRRRSCAAPTPAACLLLAAPPPPEEAVMAAREAAKSAATLDELRAILERFEGCALRTTAKQLVFADGNPQARLMFVGEAPGREEDIEGLPVRRALGKIARPDAGRDRARPHAGLYRQHRAVASAGKPRPLAARNRDLPAVHPAPDRTRRSRKSWSVSASRRPRRCSASPTASARRAGAGSAYRNGAHEIRAMPTFHPAYLLRSPLEKRFAWSDFLAIKKALDVDRHAAPVCLRRLR